MANKRVKLIFLVVQILLDCLYPSRDQSDCPCIQKIAKFAVVITICPEIVFIDLLNRSFTR